MSDAECVEVQLLPSGWSFAAPRDQSLLRSARDAGIVLPSACRNGTCRACICRASRGTVTYRIEWPGLSREGKAEGHLLPCVAHPESHLVLEAPAAFRLPGLS